jgi:monodechloroaminopyrrolnitrin synthase
MGALDFQPELNASSRDHISPLDPLCADTKLAQLPDWNEARDVNAMAGALADLAPSEAQAGALGPFEACAALRDLGMLLGSLKRHGVEPAEAVPSAIPALLILGRICGMVPRDTVYHYGPWNPTGVRQRRFTRDSNEDGLIHCVRAAAPGVEACIQALVEARASEPDSPLFADGCRHAARSVMTMVDSINFARMKVDVVFFARVLRPYFEAVAIGDKSYMGPAAAHLPLSLVDHLTWGSDCADATYRLFQEDSTHYTVPRWRALSSEVASAPSLVTRVIEALNASTAADVAVTRGAIAVYAILRVLLAFRGRHKVMADKAYEPQVRLYPVGSGGFSTDVVARILEVTRSRSRELKQAVKRRRNASLRPPSDIAALLASRGSTSSG